MKTFRNVLLGALFSAAISMPALASVSQPGLQDSLTDANLVFEINNAQPMQLAELSSQEMKETDGAGHWWWQHSHRHSHLYAGLSSHYHFHATHHSGRQWRH